MDYPETPRQAALREAEEEVSLPRNADQGNDPLITIRQEVTLLDHQPSWQYTTFIADENRPFQPIRPPQDFEGKEVPWVPIDQVGVQGGRYYSLFPAFGQTWDRLRDLIRAMDGPAQPAQPAIPPFIPPVQPESGTAELTIGFPVTVPGAKPPTQNRQVNPSFQPAAPPNISPGLGFPKTIPGPQTGQNVQAITPAQGVNPTPPPPITATTGTTLDTVWTPAPSGVRITSDDGDEEDWRKSPEEVKGDNVAPGGPPAMPHVPDPPNRAPSPSVESNPDDEMVDDDIIYVPLRGTSDPTFAGGPIRYTSWTKRTTGPRGGSQCQPS